MTVECGQFIREAHPVVRQGPLARHGHVAPPVSPASEMGWWGARQRSGRDQGRAVAGEPGDAGMRMVSMASARVIGGRVVVSRRASIHIPAPRPQEKDIVARTPAFIARLHSRLHPSADTTSVAI